VSPATTDLWYAPHEAFSASQVANFLALAAHTAAASLALRAAYSSLVRVLINIKSFNANPTSKTSSAFGSYIEYNL
jgi:hypothetical protein